jgi:hypothetical protein
MGEEDPIKVFARNGKWLVDYGSYAHGFHKTRDQAIQTATQAAKDDERDLVIQEELVGGK